MKIWVCSTVDGYVCNLQIYSGKKTNSPEKGQAMRVVKDLVTPFTESWREITADNLFSSVALIEDLWRVQTLYTGTMRANKPQIPPEFLQNKDRDPKSALVGYNGNMMLTSFFERKGKKCVNIITSKSFDAAGDTAKPAVVEYYNKTKGGVDVGDQTTRSSTVSRRSRVWPKKIFFELIDIACLNSFYIFTKKFPNWLAKKPTRRSEFLRILAEQMAIDHMKERISKGHLSQDLSKGIEEFIENVSNEGICFSCGHASGNKCVRCTKFYCESHRVVLAVVCCKTCKDSKDIVSIDSTQTVSKRCQKCSKRKITKTNKKCSFCCLFVCRNCSVEKSVIVCTDCKNNK